MEIKVGCDGDSSTAVQGDVGTATTAGFRTNCISYSYEYYAMEECGIPREIRGTYLINNNIFILTPRWSDAKRDQHARPYTESTP